MKSARRRASVLAAAMVPVALVLPLTVCGSAPARATVSQSVHPPMLKAALEGSYATVAHTTSKARVAYQPARIVALTFDDGPGKYTPKILAILRAKGVNATFFVVGGQVQAHPGMTRALARAGMSVQNHTWNHPNLARARSATILSEIARTDRVITAATGVRPACVRPPGGAYDTTVIRLAARGRHRVVNWSRGTDDWMRPGVSYIRSRALKATNNAIVLMHDGGGNRSQTVAALPAIINGLRAKGYSFVTICQR